MAQRLNYALTRGCDLLLSPLAKLPPFWGILLLSLLTSLFVLVVYRAVSSPAKVRETKDRIKANILAIRLYRDFWKTIVASFFKSLYYTAKYFALNLGPVLLVLPLLFLLFVQMDIRYGMRPFRPGEEIVVKARFDRDLAGLDAGVRPDPHFRALMNPVYITALREVDWKLRAGEKGSTAIAITVDGATASKNLVIGDELPAQRLGRRSLGGPPALSNRRLAASSLANFIYPAEKPLEPGTPLRSVAIEYPARSISFLGIRTHWLVWYLVLTMVIALALKNRFGVEF
jgi:hypothetical protein